jgi:hypothetical protein
MISRTGKLRADSVRITEFNVRISPGPEGGNLYTSFQGKYALVHAETGTIIGSGNFDQPGKIAGEQLHALVTILEENLCDMLFEGPPLQSTTTDSGVSEEEAPVDDVPGL